MHIVGEATGVYWQAVWHILSDGEFELVLANAAQIEKVPWRRTETNDAAWLAELMARGPGKERLCALLPKLHCAMWVIRDSVHRRYL